jgi:glycerol uptake facilitator-like aquaporin
VKRSRRGVFMACGFSGAKTRYVFVVQVWAFTAGATLNCCAKPKTRETSPRNASCESMMGVMPRSPGNATAATSCTIHYGSLVLIS